VFAAPVAEPFAGVEVDGAGGVAFGVVGMHALHLHPAGAVATWHVALVELQHGEEVGAGGFPHFTLPAITSALPQIRTCIPAAWSLRLDATNRVWNAPTPTSTAPSPVICRSRRRRRRR